MRSQRSTNIAKVVAASCVSLAMSNAAFAESVFSRDKDMCFQRTYSKSHMKKHPNQTVTFIQVNHNVKGNSRLIEGYNSSSNRGQEALIDVSVRFKGSAKTFTNTLLCNQDSKMCGVECDGGSAAITRKTNGDLLIDVRETGGFVVQGGCGEGEEPTHYLGSASDDKLFKLFTTKMKLCSQPAN